ncbi:hypothetical protein [Nostoc sp.]|uniref:hypothetical protein n=1 Tax=Nostoc sp. TaxID=1180 RepID=UPI002FFC540A
MLLVGVQTEDVSVQRFEDGLAELVRLVESAGGIVLDTMRQKRLGVARRRHRAHPQTVVGKGKVASSLGLETLKMRSLQLIDEPVKAMPAALPEAQNAVPQNSY